MSGRPEILVVDDEPGFLAHLCAELQMMLVEYRIVPFESFEALRQHMVNSDCSEVVMVIADAILGDLDRGAHVLALSRQLAPHAKRILISNKATRADMEHAINTCALDGYLEKEDQFTESSVQLLRNLLVCDRVGTPINHNEAYKLCLQLARVPVSKREFAHVYKTLMKDLLLYVFYPALVSPRTELAIRSGTKFVDIVFYNAASDGVLFDVKSRLGSILVPIETKNSSILRSSTFAQIEGYLVDAVGRFGVICFRGEIRKWHLKHGRAISSQGKLVMVLTDQEVVSLARSRIVRRRGVREYQKALDDFLRSKYVNMI